MKKPVVYSQLNRGIRLTACLSCLSLVALADPAHAAVLAYYQFESGGPTTPTSDSSGNGYSANLVNGSGVNTATIASGGMFGNALSLTGGGARAEVPDASAPLLDTTYLNLSVSMWVKTSSWTGAQAILTGKMGGSTNRGWYISKNPGATAPLVFIGYQTNTNSPLKATSYNLDNPLPSTTDYVNIVATFDAAGNTMDLYLDGKLLAPAIPGGTDITQINGANSGSVLIGTSGNSAATSWIGQMDDYVFASDTFGAQKVALIHGLGRLAGISFGTDMDIIPGALPGVGLDAVLAAYKAGGSAIVGESKWTYASDAGGGTTIGAYGGTLADGTAYIVLGTDGSGVMGQVHQICFEPRSDTDGDHDVDQYDFGVLQHCFTGDVAQIPFTDPKCRCLDVGSDYKINSTELDLFLKCMTGPSIPWASSTDCP